MRKDNSTFDSTPSGWCVCGGMIVPKKQIMHLKSNIMTQNTFEKINEYVETSKRVQSSADRDSRAANH